MTDKTGGPAFPQNTKIVAAAGQELHQGFFGGMTLRDYFAAKAMQGWLSTYPDDHAPDEVFEGGVADFAYRIADAMLKAREA